MGLRKSVFGVASSLVGLLRTRLELLTLEAADEKARLLKVLGMAFAALLFLTLAVLVFTVTVAVLFWPTEDRYLALGLLAAFYGIVGIGPIPTGFGIEAELKISLPGMDRELAEKLVAAAHIVCPYSNATRGNIDVTLTIV